MKPLALLVVPMIALWSACSGSDTPASASRDRRQLERRGERSNAFTNIKQTIDTAEQGALSYRKTRLGSPEDGDDEIAGSQDRRTLA